MADLPVVNRPAADLMSISQVQDRVNIRPISIIRVRGRSLRECIRMTDISCITASLRTIGQTVIIITDTVSGRFRTMLTDIITEVMHIIATTMCGIVLTTDIM